VLNLFPCSIPSVIILILTSDRYTLKESKHFLSFFVKCGKQPGTLLWQWI
jgi:hypothetical protein